MAGAAPSADPGAGKALERLTLVGSVVTPSSCTPGQALGDEKSACRVGEARTGRGSKPLACGAKPNVQAAGEALPLAEGLLMLVLELASTRKEKARESGAMGVEVPQPAAARDAVESGKPVSAPRATLRALKAVLHREAGGMLRAWAALASEAAQAGVVPACTPSPGLPDIGVVAMLAHAAAMSARLL